MSASDSPMRWRTIVSALFHLNLAESFRARREMSLRNAEASSASEVCQLSGPLLMHPRRSVAPGDGQGGRSNDPSPMRCSRITPALDFTWPTCSFIRFHLLAVTFLLLLTLALVHGQLEVVQPAVVNNKLHVPCRDRPPGCALTCPYGYVWGFGALCVCLCQPDPCLV